MKVALGVSGGIAAYKAAELVRLLQERDLEVQVVMTRGAREFITPLTFAALSGRKVITEIFAGQGAEPNVESAIEHTNQDYVAHHCGRREHIGLVLLPQGRFAGGGVDHVVETGIGGSEKDLALRHSR